MKTLHLRRSAGIISGVGPAGMVLASLEGKWAAQAKIRYGTVFTSTVRNSQDTALGFLIGYDKPLTFAAPIAGLGSDELLHEIDDHIDPAVKEKHLTAFDELLISYGLDTITTWSTQAAEGIQQIFRQSYCGEIALAWGHARLIQLALFYYVIAEPRPTRLAMRKDWEDFGPLEGISITQDDQDEILIGHKIPAQRSEQAAAGA